MEIKNMRWVCMMILFVAALDLAAAGPGYHVFTKYKVGGGGWWD